MGNFPKPRWIATGSTGYFWMTTEFCARQEQTEVMNSYGQLRLWKLQKGSCVHLQHFALHGGMLQHILQPRKCVHLFQNMFIPFETEIPTVLWIRNIRNKHFENIRRCLWPKFLSFRDDPPSGLLQWWSRRRTPLLRPWCGLMADWTCDEWCNLASFLSVISAWWNIWKAVSQTL